MTAKHKIHCLSAEKISLTFPYQPGTTSACYEWHIVVANDYCSLLESTYGITFAQLQAWNTGLDDACDNLELGEAYCVSGPD